MTAMIIKPKDKIYDNIFRATGLYEDPRHYHYATLGLVKKDDYIDVNGDIIKKEWYESYDTGTKIYENIAIELNRSYTRNSGTGILESRTEEVNYFDENGDIQLTVQLPIKIYSTSKGIQGNQRARKNLMEKAKELFFIALITNNLGDMVLSTQQKDDFLALSTSQRKNYEDSDVTGMVELLDNTLISGNLEYRTYMTAQMVSDIKAILDVSYTA